MGYGGWVSAPQLLDDQPFAALLVANGASLISTSGLSTHFSLFATHSLPTLFHTFLRFHKTISIPTTLSSPLTSARFENPANPR